MGAKLKEMGLFPGAIRYNQWHCWESKSLWRYPLSPGVQRRHPAALPESAVNLGTINSFQVTEAISGL